MVDMSNIKPVILLLFLPPMLGELLTGNAPPLRFFHPVMLSAFVLLYGCGALLIREAKVRWNLQWSVIFLAVAYAIVEEGLTTKAIFNTQWKGVAPYSGYGMAWGVQWVWTIGVLFSHTTVSMLIPLAIVELLWSSKRNTAFLGKRMLILTIMGFCGVTLLGMLSFGNVEGQRTIPFIPEQPLLAVTFAVVVLLCWLAYRFRAWRVRTGIFFLLPPVVFALAGFVAPVFFLIVPNEMLKRGAPGVTTVVVELAFVCLSLAFVFLEVYHRGVTRRHLTSLIIGSLTPYILLTPVHEYLGRSASVNPKTGMVAVGVIAAILLYIWRRVVLRREPETGAGSSYSPCNAETC